MGKHRRIDSIQNATGAEAGSHEKTRGHTKCGLWVTAENIDPPNDNLQVRVEVSPDGDRFSPIDSGAPAVTNVLVLSDADLYETDEAGVYVGYISHDDIPAEYIRANITDFADSSGGDLTVTAYLFISGWTGRGKSFKEREDLPKGELGR